MLEYLLLGGGFGFAAAVQPGPLQAFLLARAASDGWRRTLPAALAPVLSDGPIAALVLLVIGRLPATGQQALRVSGGLLLLYLAWAAYREARTPSGTATSAHVSPPRTLLQATTVNLLNPNPYLSWSLILGPLLLQAWQAAPAHGIALLVSFYVTMIASTAVILLPFAGARALGPRVGRAMLGVSAAALAAFGVYQLWAVGAAVFRDLR